MSIMELNGGSVVAMVGEGCVAIACDLRLGNQALTVACNFEKVFAVTEKCYVGLPGLASDTITVKDKLRQRVNLYGMKEERTIEPETFSHLCSSTLYERRFGPYFVEPVIAGLTNANEPFIAGMDLIGCLNAAEDFIVSGTASEKLFGMAESLWEPNLSPEDLFETISQTLLNAVDRDAYSGWGAVVYILEKNPNMTEEAPQTLEDLEYVLRNDTKIQVAGVDVDGVLRGKIMMKDKFLSAAKDGGFGFCSVVFGWDIHDATYKKELKISTLANGYKDLSARIDLNTYRRTPTTPSLPFFLITFIDPDTNSELSACPRGLLQRVVARSAEAGFGPYAGAEYEYFNFRETPSTAAAKNFQNLAPLSEGMHGYSLLRPSLNPEYFHDLYDSCASFGIQVEGHHTETGPGVYESALAYQDMMRMADNATLFKWTAKTVGYKYGVMPTFMAKPYADQPGCSGHVHISLRDKNGKNVFAVSADEQKDGREGAAFEDTKRISEIAEHFLAGVLKGLPDIMPCLVPTVNGYKRLVESYWAPVNVSYAYENRVASVRIISPPLAAPSATRLEVRVPGADMNPYFTFAAVLGCGLYGIKNKLPLTQPPLDTASGTQKLVRLPKSLQSATANFAAKGSMAREVLGDDFVDHFAGTRENEWELFESTVTDWEMKRYFELA